MKNICINLDTSKIAKGFDTSALTSGFEKTQKTMKEFQNQMLAINKRLATALRVIQTQPLVENSAHQIINRL